MEKTIEKQVTSMLNDCEYNMYHLFCDGVITIEQNKELHTNTTAGYWSTDAKPSDLRACSPDHQ